MAALFFFNGKADQIYSTGPEAMVARSWSRSRRPAVALFASDRVQLGTARSGRYPSEMDCDRYGG